MMDQSSQSSKRPFKPSNYIHKRKTKTNISSKRIPYDRIVIEIKELSKSFALCYKEEKFTCLFKNKMFEDSFLLSDFEKKFNDFMKKYNITISRIGKVLVSHNEEGCFIFDFVEIWIIYINLNYKKLLKSQISKIINQSLNYEVDVSVLSNYFKYIIKHLNIMKNIYTNIPNQNEKYQKLVKKLKIELKSEKYDFPLRNNDKFSSIINENQAKNKELIEIKEEDDEFKSFCNDSLTFILDPFSKKKNYLYKYILTPVRTTLKNSHSCEKIMNKIKQEKMALSNIKVNPNKYIKDLNCESGLLKDKFKQMLEKGETNFNLDDLKKPSINHLKRNQNEIRSNSKIKENLSEIKIISDNFNGNKNFALLEILSDNQNKLVLTPLKVYSNYSDRKNAESDLKLLYSENQYKNFVYHPYNTEFMDALKDDVEKEKKDIFSDLL